MVKVSRSVRREVVVMGLSGAVVGADELAGAPGELHAVGPRVAPDGEVGRQRRVDHLGRERLKGQHAPVVDLVERGEELLEGDRSRAEGATVRLAEVDVAELARIGRRVDRRRERDLLDSCGTRRGGRRHSAGRPPR